MTNPDPHTFLRPYVRAIYLPDTALGQLHTPFVSLEGLRAWAALRGLALRDAMSELLEQHIWPERFRRNFGLVAAQDMARRLQSRVLVQSSMNGCTERRLTVSFRTLMSAMICT